jgi:hypothetical protein
MKCARKACDNPINTRGYYNIKNDNTVNGRNYCVACGRSIVEFNPGIEYNVVLENRMADPNQWDDSGLSSAQYLKETIASGNYIAGQRQAEIDWQNDTIHSEEFENEDFEKGYTDRIKGLSVGF